MQQIERILLIFLCTFGLLPSLGCNADQNRAEESVAQHLKQTGVRDVKLDLFLQAADSPDRAYVSVTATHPFANSEGNLQKEFLGFIVRKQGQEWKVDKNVAYTTDKDTARSLLLGRKPG
jgi:hypothetical protein